MQTCRLSMFERRSATCLSRACTTFRCTFRPCSIAAQHVVQHRIGHFCFHRGSHVPLRFVLRAFSAPVFVICSCTSKAIKNTCSSLSRLWLCRKPSATGYTGQRQANQQPRTAAKATRCVILEISDDRRAFRRLVYRAGGCFLTNDTR